MLTLGAFIHESKEPDVLKRLEALGDRVRAIVDDHGEQGEDESAESISAHRLAAAGAEVKRMHFGRRQHNKVLIVRRDGQPVRVLTGSTNYSLRGLYIQANTALVFDDPGVAANQGAGAEVVYQLSFRPRADGVSKTAARLQSSLLSQHMLIRAL